MVESDDERFAGTRSVTLVPSTAPRGVIFDGDDTLWLTEHLYDEARASAREIIQRAGLDGASWEQWQRALDLANVERVGHSPSRFPTSCVQALDAVDVDGRCRREVREAVWAAAQQVFTADAPLRPGATRVVSDLVRRGLRLGLLTKGDADVQRRRIDCSGLRPLFDVVAVVAKKSPGDFRRVVTQLDLEPREVLSVGNSVRSDIMPSLSAGVNAIWVPAYVWDYERSEDEAVPDHVARITKLDELLEVLDC